MIQSALPAPLRNADRSILKLNVYNAGGERVLSHGTAVGRKKFGDAVKWLVVAEGASAAMEFVCPPCVVKRVKV